MDRREFYYKQTVTDEELDSAFEGAEQADRAIVADMGWVGIRVGGGVTQSSPASMIVNLEAPTVAYDSAGRRVQTATELQIDMSLTENGIPTSVAGAGNQRYVSAFLRFKRAESDPRSDGNNSPVNFIQAESCEVVVRMGTEAVSATPPPLVEDEILLCDVLRTYGKTSIANADILTDRVQPMRRAALEDVSAASLISSPDDWSGPLKTIADALVAAGTQPEQKYSLKQLLLALSELLGRTTGTGDDGAAAIGAVVPAYPQLSGAGASNVGAFLTMLGGYLNQHLSASGTAHSSFRISNSANGWLTAGNLGDAMYEIVNDLGGTTAGAPGAALIGVPTLTYGDVTISANVMTTLAMLAAQLNVAYAFPIEIRNVIIDDTPSNWSLNTTYANYLTNAIAGTGNKVIHIPIRIPQGKVLQRVEVYIQNSGHSVLPAPGARIVAALGKRVLGQPNWGYGEFYDGNPATVAAYDSTDGYVITVPGGAAGGWIQAVNNMLTLNIQGELAATGGQYNNVLGATAFIF